MSKNVIMAGFTLRCVAHGIRKAIRYTMQKIIGGASLY